MNAPQIWPWSHETPPADAYTDPDIQLDEDVRFWIIGGPAGEVLADVLFHKDAETTLAIARLIAAAPTLLAAARDAERVMTDADLDHEPPGDEGRQALEAVRAALAKAEGRL